MKLKIYLLDLYICLIILNIISILIDNFFRIEIFRQIIGSLYLTIFIGPILIYSLFKDIPENYGFLESMLHGIGINILCLLSGTILLNFFAELNKYTLTFLLNFLMLFIIYVKYKSIRNVSFNLNLNLIFTYLVIFFVSLISTYICTYYLINWIMIIVILFNSVLILVMRKLDKNASIYYIAMCSVSLLILNSTTSYFFRITDNIVEYHFSKLVIEHGHWLYYLHNDINSMPGAVLIPTIYSEYCNYNLDAFFRIMLPILASLIPIILYKSYLKLFNHEVSIFSSIFFITTYIFYTWFGLTTKQVSSGIFLALLILLISSDYNSVSKAVLGILYSIGIIICHYGTADIVMMCVLGFYLVNSITKYKTDILKGTYIIFYFVTAISWYIYTASSAPFSTIVAIIEHYIRLLLFNKTITPSSYGGQILFSRLPTYLIILKYLYYISIFLIIVGLIFSIANRKTSSIKVNKFFVLSLIAIIFDFLVFSGNLSDAITPDRVFQITSFFISPFFAIGSIHISKLTKIDVHKAIPIFLLIFLLFNTCLTAEVIWRYNVGPTVCVSYSRIVKNGSVMEREYLSRVYLFLTDIYGVRWIHTFHKFYLCFCGVNSKKDFYYSFVTNIKILVVHGSISKKSYLYLNHFNTITSKIKITRGLHPKLTSISSLRLYRFNKIYSNYHCNIFLYT